MGHTLTLKGAKRRMQKHKQTSLSLLEFECDYCGSKSYEKRKNLQKKLGIASNKCIIFSCLKCGLVSIFPPPTIKERLEFYRDYGNEKNRKFDESIRQKTIYPYKLEKLKKLSKGLSLLDIGAGLGTFSFMAKQAGFDVTGIELSPEQCRYAKTHFNIDLLNIDIFDLSEHIGKFDIIHMHHVMEHLATPSKAFDIIKSLLKDDGIFLFEVPYQLNRIQDILIKRKKRKIKFIYDHLFFFSPTTIRNYIISKDFSIIEFRQHRHIDFEKKIFKYPKYILRIIFYYLTTSLWLPSGSFLELYCKKNSS